MQHGRRTEENKDELSRIVHVNEVAKRLVVHSFQVNLLALDAMVQSKRAGGRLRGFDEVSKQMRDWSAELKSQLGELADLTRVCVTEASLGIKMRRTVRLLGEAARRSRNGDAAESAARRARDLAGECTASLDTRWSRVSLQIAELTRLGMMACVLSRSAMIEAQSGAPAERVQLMHVARDFYCNSEDVLHALRTLAKDAGGER